MLPHIDIHLDSSDLLLYQVQACFFLAFFFFLAGHLSILCVFKSPAALDRIRRRPCLGSVPSRLARDPLYCYSWLLIGDHMASLCLPQSFLCCHENTDTSSPRTPAPNDYFIPFRWCGRSSESCHDYRCAYFPLSKLDIISNITHCGQQGCRDTCIMHNWCFLVGWFRGEGLIRVFRGRARFGDSRETVIFSGPLLFDCCGVVFAMPYI